LIPATCAVLEALNRSLVEKTGHAFEMTVIVRAHSAGATLHLLGAPTDRWQANRRVCPGWNPLRTSHAVGDLLPGRPKTWVEDHVAECRHYLEAAVGVAAAPEAPACLSRLAGPAECRNRLDGIERQAVCRV
jgi:hypothetical protein